jgi:NifU-like protein involved in Fe-S cluster formation
VVSTQAQKDGVTDYSETFLDHYRRPRNLGDLAAADAVALVHDAVCGDVLRLAVALDRDAAAGTALRGCIRDARFKAYGCAATIAVASVLTEAIIGRTVEEVESLGAGDLMSALDGLPPGRIHAAVLGGKALRAVLARLP